jgi:hypothetical protein
MNLSCLFQHRAGDGPLTGGGRVQRRAAVYALYPRPSRAEFVPAEINRRIARE